MSRSATPEGLSARAASQAITAELLERVGGQVETLAARLQAGESAELLAFLRFSSHFPRYSFANQLLIWMQAPTARYVAGFNTWKAEGRQVKKGAKAVRILAPLSVTDHDAAPVDGKPPMKLIGFKYVSIFADFDTEGEPFPDSSFLVVPGGDEAHRALIDSLTPAAPVPVRWEDAPANPAHGWTDGTNIVLNASKCAGQPAHALRVFFHEWAHAELHFTDAGKRPDDLPSRELRELEADAAAYVLCAGYGLDVAAQVGDYVLSWGGNPDALRASLNRIARAVSQVQARIWEQQRRASAAD